MSNILIITNEIPFPQYKNGVCSTIFNYIECWRKNDNNVDLMYMVNEDKSSEEILKDKFGIRIKFCNCIGKEIVKKIAGRILIKPRNCWNLSTKKLSYIDCQNYDYVVIGCLGAALTLDKLENVSGKIVFFEADSGTMYYKRNLLQTSSFIRKVYLLSQVFCVSKLEKRIYKKVDVTAFVSAVDFEFAKKNFEGKFVANPIGVKIPKEAIKTLKENDKCNTIHIGFSGIMDYEPNIMAAEYIIEKIMPLLDAVGVDYQVHLIGKNPKDMWSKNDYCKNGKLVITGFLESIENYVSNMDIYISPLFLGSGMKNKILQAMGIGVPMVCSQVSVEGICELVNGENYYEANDNASEWVDCIIKLATNYSLRKKFSDECKTIINEKYSWESSAKKILGEL